MPSFSLDLRFKRFLLIVAVTLLGVTTTYSQDGVSAWITTLQESRQFVAIPLLKKTVVNGTQERNRFNSVSLTINPQQLALIRLQQPAAITLDIPMNDHDHMELLLGKIELVTPDFNLGTLGTNATSTIAFEKGTYYRGVVADASNSVVAVTFFDDDMSAMIAIDQANYELIKKENSTDQYRLLDAKQLPVLPNFECEAVSPPGVQKPTTVNTTDGVGCKRVNVYFECDYRLYTDKGSSTTNVTNYVTSLFNQVAALYSNENIELQLQSMNIWTTSDPYASYTSSANLLPAFRTNVGSNFNGTVAHFLTTRNIGGGIAYLDVLCNKSYAHGVSYIQNTFSNISTYSWSVQVITHELGHNFGANHTHWCGWTKSDGTTGALDNCYTTEGGCPAGATPVNGGTIMSYCHMTTNGINFTNGFGSIPGNLIRSRLVNASCITATGTAPTGICANNITASTATISWNTVIGATDYTVQFRIRGSSAWIFGGTTTSNSSTLNSLNSSTSYEWQVKSNCSEFSSSNYFNTPAVSNCTAPIGLATTYISGVSALVSWLPVAGANNYTVKYKRSGASNWITCSAQTGTTLTLSGLTSSTTYNWTVSANCSGASTQANFTTASSGCLIPFGLNSSNISRTNATLGWSAVPGASSYTIGYKKSSETKWTQVGPQNSTTVNLTGLAAATVYDWKVKANCSNYTTPLQFSTTTQLPTLFGQESSEPVTIFPNPASSKIVIEVGKVEDFGIATHVYITDMVGKLQMTAPFTDEKTEIDIAELANGIYMVQVIDEKGKALNKRLFKR